MPLLVEAFAPAEGLLVDGYCGIGTYSLPLAAAGWRVLGLELHPGAVELANRNARLNGLEQRCLFRANAVGEALESLLPETAALLLDPPRKGLEPQAVQAILGAPPARLIYISCDPATLARDLRLLCATAYRPTRIQPIDFFPNTTHVETVAVLERIG